MAVQACLSFIWSETPKTGFLVTGLVLYLLFPVVSFLADQPVSKVVFHNFLFLHVIGLLPVLFLLQPYKYHDNNSGVIQMHRSFATTTPTTTLPKSVRPLGTPRSAMNKSEIAILAFFSPDSTYWKTSLQIFGKSYMYKHVYISRYLCIVSGFNNIPCQTVPSFL